MNIKITADEKGTKDTEYIHCVVLYIVLYNVHYCTVQYSTFTINTLHTPSDDTVHTLYKREHIHNKIVHTIYKISQIHYIMIQIEYNIAHTVQHIIHAVQ